MRNGPLDASANQWIEFKLSDRTTTGCKCVAMMVLDHSHTQQFYNLSALLSSHRHVHILNSFV